MVDFHITIRLDLRFNKLRCEKRRQYCFAVLFEKKYRVHYLISATPVRLFTRIDPKLKKKIVLNKLIFIAYRSYPLKNTYN